MFLETLEALARQGPYSQIVTTIFSILMTFKSLFPAKISLLSSRYKCQLDTAKWISKRHIKINISTTELLLTKLTSPLYSIPQWVIHYSISLNINLGIIIVSFFLTPVSQSPNTTDNISFINSSQKLSSHSIFTATFVALLIFCLFIQKNH